MQREELGPKFLSLFGRERRNIFSQGSLKHGDLPVGVLAQHGGGIGRGRAIVASRQENLLAVLGEGAELRQGVARRTLTLSEPEFARSSAPSSTTRARPLQEPDF